jgi:hypothetical protein
LPGTSWLVPAGSSRVVGEWNSRTAVGGSLVVRGVSWLVPAGSSRVVGEWNSHTVYVPSAVGWSILAKRFQEEIDR